MLALRQTHVGVEKNLLAEDTWTPSPGPVEPFLFIFLVDG
jgi:hypothetical protein